MNMTNKYTYQYDTKSHIMHKKHFGTFTINMLIDSWDEAIEKHLVPSETMTFLLDYTEAKLDMNIGAAEKMVNYFNEQSHLFEDKKIAVVVNTPENIVHPILAQARPRNYILRIFSTLPAAYLWLMS